MNVRRSLGAAIIAALAMLLVACTGLPTSGPVQAGLVIGDDGELADPTIVAQGPTPGADPAAIVAGFLQASVTPSGNWETAHKFLAEDFSSVWKPEDGVTIDSSVVSRKIDSDGDPDDASATTAVVRVQLDQVASIDGVGAYSEQTGASKRMYRLTRAKGGEWRISEAPDGIVLDTDSFGQVYRKYALQYFDQSWTHLVPDVRWFPRRESMATSITRALISGDPSPWLAPAVRTSFADDVTVSGDSVPVEAQVADVSLNRAALAASPSTLARMRTQLEASLAGVGVIEVRLSVDGTALDAGTVSLDDTIVDPGVLVLNDETFGAAAAGSEITPVTGLTAQIAKISAPIAAIDVARNGKRAAVQLGDGSIHTITDGNSDLLEHRPDLIEPSLDPFGFTWTVPRGRPGDLEAWGSKDERHAIEQAWPDASSISHLRVSADGARVAAVIFSGGRHRLVVASVIRGDGAVPTKLGEQLLEVEVLPGPAQGLAWVGSDSLAVLYSTPDPMLITYIVGGPSTVSPAPPADATSLSGAKTTTGVRVLASDGAVYALRGSSWQASIADVLVLGTRAGY